MVFKEVKHPSNQIKAGFNPKCIVTCSVKPAWGWRVFKNIKQLRLSKLEC